MRRFVRQLDLTSEQRSEFQRILNESEQEISQLLQRSLKEFADIMERQEDDLKTVLTPEQLQQVMRGLAVSNAMIGSIR